MMNSRRAISNMMEWTGANGRVLAGLRDSVTVLCYHRVLDPDDPVRPGIHPALVTSTHVFERQMETIAARLNPVTLSAVVRWLDGEDAIPPRAVLVTFDDGWIDTYTNAYPVMRREGIPGVVFLATGFTDTKQRQWADIAYETVATRAGHAAAAREVERLKAVAACSRPVAPVESESPVNLGWPQVQEMAAGGFEFGSHTRSHMILPCEPDDDIARELRSSREDIAARLGSAPVSFAYPDGQHDERVAGLVEQAGYRVAFTCDEGLVTRQTPRLAMPRLGIHDGVSTDSNGESSQAMFTTHLAGTIPRRYRRRAR